MENICILSFLLMIFPERFGCTSCSTNQRRLPSSNCGKLKWITKLGKGSSIRKNGRKTQGSPRSKGLFKAKNV